MTQKAIKLNQFQIQALDKGIEKDDAMLIDSHIKMIALEFLGNSNVKLVTGISDIQAENFASLLPLSFEHSIQFYSGACLVKNKLEIITDPIMYTVESLAFKSYEYLSHLVEDYTEFQDLQNDL